jgi:ABC-2 type transport system permease protein
VSSPSSTVIHDIGYRHYDGPRLGTREIERALFTETVRAAFGWGRSARSKVMPLLLLAATVLPALIICIVMSVVPLVDEVPNGYPSYPFSVQVALAVFVGSQAPAVISKDLRFRVAPLYFSRPLTRTQYVRARYAGMAVALFVLIALPLTILFVGALLAELPWDEQLPPYLAAMGGAVLHAVVLAGVGLLVAALTPRRGLGVAAIVTVLLVLSGLQGAVRALGEEFGAPTLADLAGLLSPFSLVDGTLTVLGADDTTVRAPGLDEGLGVVYPLLLVLLVAGCYALLVRRFRKVGIG